MTLTIQKSDMSEPSSQEPVEGGNKGGETTLSADDTDTVRRLLEDTEDFQKHKITSGEEAQEIIDEHGPLDIYYEEDPEGVIIGAAKASEIPLSSSGSSQSGTSTSDPDSDMTRDELKAHLGKTEARVEQMTEDVKSSLEQMDHRLDDRLDAFKAVDDKMESNTTWAFRLSAITLTIVSLILAALGVVITILISMMS